MIYLSTYLFIFKVRGDLVMGALLRPYEAVLGMGVPLSISRFSKQLI